MAEGGLGLPAKMDWDEDPAGSMIASLQAVRGMFIQLHFLCHRLIIIMSTCHCSERENLRRGMSGIGGFSPDESYRLREPPKEVRGLSSNPEF
jgi:hypothetical protein